MSFFEGLKRIFVTENIQDNIEILDESLKPFAGKQDKITNEKKLRDRYGEGIEDFSAIANGFALFGKSNVKGYNNFYKKFIDFSYKNEIEKIYEYRSIARFPEVAEVLEDVVNESTQLDISGDIIKLQIVDGDLSSNENVAKNIHKEFDNLFYKRIELPKKIDNLILSYFIDGKIYWENIIDANKPKNGILNIKKLPTETMDFSWNPISGKYNFFVQYLKSAGKLPQSLEDAEKTEDIIGFHPKQITYIDYGIYGPGGKKDVIRIFRKS